MKFIVQIFIWLLPMASIAQNVGIGTNTPNSKAILDINSTNQVLLIPRMDTQQMRAISSPPLGSIIFNSSLQTQMNYVRMGSKPGFFPGTFSANNLWLPLSPGPKILAWGIVDSSSGPENSSENILAPIKNGSGNFSVRWFGTTNSKKWYELSITNDNFSLDSMMLLITPIGNGSWDVLPSIGEIIVGSSKDATIKFTDVSRSVSGWSELDRRRRSKFSFILYDLRGY